MTALPTKARRAVTPQVAAGPAARVACEEQNYDESSEQIWCIMGFVINL